MYDFQWKMVCLYTIATPSVLCVVFFIKDLGEYWNFLAWFKDIPLSCISIPSNFLFLLAYIFPLYLSVYLPLFVTLILSISLSIFRILTLSVCLCICLSFSPNLRLLPLYINVNVFRFFLSVTYLFIPLNKMMVSYLSSITIVNATMFSSFFCICHHFLPLFHSNLLLWRLAWARKFGIKIELWMSLAEQTKHTP